MRTETAGRPGLSWIMFPAWVAMFSLVACAAGSEAGEEGLTVEVSSGTGLATFVTKEDGSGIALPATAQVEQDRPAGFLRQYGHLFGVSDSTAELRAVRASSDSLGHRHTTYQQVYQGVPVFSGILKVHQNALAEVAAANGDFHPIPAEFDITPRVSSEAAVAVAMGAITGDDPSVEQSELVIVDPGWYGDPPAGVHLAHHIILVDALASVDEAFFVDAHTGKILDQWSLNHESRYRRIYNGMGGEGLPGNLVRAEGDPPVTSPFDTNYAYDYAGDVYDFFHRAFGRDSVDDHGLYLVITVNSKAIQCPNAFWSSSLLQMAFCSGTVTDDITAHEIGHGITQFTSGLIYQNQPGQLNESYSDIWGELVDLFNGDTAFPGPPGGTPWPKDNDYVNSGLDTPNALRTTTCADTEESVRWLIGEDAHSFGGAIRDMWNPACFGHPPFANHSYQTCNPDDWGGVHSGNGTPNHAFAIMTDGKSYRGYDVAAIGPIKAAAVWYRAATTYLTVAADFRDAYFALNRSALDLIGTAPLDPRTGLPGDVFTADDAVQVDLALQAVEMNTDGRCGASADLLNPDPPEECGQAVEVYATSFDDGAPGWTLSGIGDPDTPYDWFFVDQMPIGRTGLAWHCPDIDDDCYGSPPPDESAVHSLTTPPILFPARTYRPTLTFTHQIASESRYDGGNVWISVNDGPWILVPFAAFTYNPYSATLRSEAYGNTNPMAGKTAFTGAGGTWGKSVADLSEFVGDDDVVQFRFSFGKDSCGGAPGGWYLYDFAVYTCLCEEDEDCADNNPCTDDSCGVDGFCNRIPNLSAFCTDDNPCTDDFCDEEGVCVSVVDEGNFCTDDNPCTDDVCASDGSCVSTDDDTNECDDGVFCNGPEVCQAGECIYETDPCVGYCHEDADICVPILFWDDFENGNSRGWEMDSPDNTAIRGFWEIGDPIGTDYDGEPSQPEDAFAGEGCAFTAQNEEGVAHDDVDSGVVYLVSPSIDLSGVVNAPLSYVRWYYNRDAGEDPGDFFTAEVSNDDGASWVTLEYLDYNQSVNTWTPQMFALEDYVNLTGTMRLRFGASDGPGSYVMGSMVEAAIDDVILADEFECDEDADCADTDPCTEDTCVAFRCIHPPAECLEVVSTVPPGGAIDARQPYTNLTDGSAIGWDLITLEPAYPTTPPAASFTVSEFGGDGGTPGGCPGDRRW